MRYLHINNLYKDTTILKFKQCYALEKIHGTSAHVGLKDGKLVIFSGGASHERFSSLFDQERLTEALKTICSDCDIVVFGEAYGGKQQGMRDTYGEELKFVAFDVKIGDAWLRVPNAHGVCNKLSLEFVHYKLIDVDLPAIDAERDADSEQAIRNGVGPGKMREGVVLRPVEEFTKSNGSRMIVKHKRDEFMETATPRKVDVGKLEVMANAEAIAKEWVTPMRLAHVLDKVQPTDIKDTPRVIAAMFADVEREAIGEIVMTKEVKSRINSRTAIMFKQHLHAALYEVQ